MHRFSPALPTPRVAAHSEAGSRSREDAIQARITIEPTDIADLAEAISGAPEDVAVVLERLLAASENHLAAFERQA